MGIVKEFLAPSDALKIKPLLDKQKGREEADRISSLLHDNASEFRGIFVVDSTDESSCTAVAIGAIGDRKVLHLNMGIQVHDPAVTSWSESMSHLIDFAAQERHIALADQLYPLTKDYSRLLNAYSELGFRSDVDPAVLLAKEHRENGIEVVPQELTPQNVRDTYVWLDLK